MQYQICVESVHEILQRIKDGEGIARGEGKTTALLYYAIEMLIDHPGLTIDYASFGKYDFVHDMVVNICSPENLDCSMKSTSTMKRSIVIENKSFLQYSYVKQNGRKTYKPYSKQQFEIFDVNDSMQDVLIYSGHDKDIIEDMWFIPKEYYGPEQKYTIDNSQTLSIIDSWGKVNA